MLPLLLVVGGCAARPIHPGAANTFDSSSYDALIVAHSVIETTKTDLANGAFPAGWTLKIHEALNGLIRAYDVAQTAYTAYHASAVAGTATPAQATDLQTKLGDVNTQTVALTAAKAGK